MQFQALPAMKEYTATPLSTSREGAARPARHQQKWAPAGAHKGDLYTFRGPQAPEQGKHVPEVGLELHSSPCKHWTPPETCGIRPSPARVRPSPTPKVCTLCTPLSSRRRMSRYGKCAPSDQPGTVSLVLSAPLRHPVIVDRLNGLLFRHPGNIPFIHSNGAGELPDQS